MITPTTSRCDNIHGVKPQGSVVERVKRARPMTPPHFGRQAGPASEWQPSGHLYTRSQLIACLRAGIIALALLVVLALIVLS